MIKKSLLFIYILVLSHFLAFSQIIPQKPLIQYVEVAGRAVAIDSLYKISFENNAIKIGFKSSDSDSRNRLEARIIETKFKETKVGKWVELKHATFRNDTLFPAVYLLEIVNVTPEKVRSKPLFIQIKIEYPWWRSWWFWGACFITVFGLFYGRERFLKFWADEEQRHYRQVTELELRTLQLQMNPHFVFNALNAIQSFILTRDSIAANNYLSKFANLIRLFLDSSRSKYIALPDEIKLLSLYVEMEMLRFDNKFDFHLSVAPDVNRFFDLPTMILQPFIENAINHGLRYKDSKGNLYIDFFNQGKYLVCRIQDDGVGREKARKIQSKSRNGYKSQGLKITEERLNIFNAIADSDIQFFISDRIIKPENEQVDVGTMVEIKFPKFI